MTILNNKFFNRCDFFVILWCLYWLQDILYPSSMLNRIIQFLMILWGALVALKYIIHTSSNTGLKGISLLVIMYVVYGGINILLNDTVNIGYQIPSYLYLQNSLNSLLPIYIFYDYSKRGYLSEDRIRFYFVLLFVVAVLTFFNFQAKALDQTSDEDITNNIGYRFLCLFPMVVFLYKKPLIQMGMFAIIIGFILLGMKRGAILIGAICTLIFVIRNIKNAETQKMKGASVFCAICIIAGIVWYAGRLFATNDYFAFRVEQTITGDSSDRDIIYGTIWHAIVDNPDPLDLLIGRGANATVKVSGSFAHQDWLEIFCNNGLLGVFIFISFFIGLFRSWRASKIVLKSNFVLSFSLLLIITFTKTLFSASIQDLELSQTLLMGYFLYAIHEGNTSINLDNKEYSV